MTLRSSILCTSIAMAFLGAADALHGQGLPFIPNDPYFFTGTPAGFPGQWHLDKQTSGALIDANVSAAWAKGFTGEGVRIGIVEAFPFAVTHPDLSPNYSPEFDYAYPIDTGCCNYDAFQQGHHATAVAGLAAARGGNGIGVTGAAPRASLSVLDTDLALGHDWPSQAAAALHRNDAIDIKNYSLGIKAAYQFTAYPSYQQSFAASAAAGTINVRGAANDRLDANHFSDKNFFDVIVVGATGADGRFSNYSNFGANLAVTAPSNSFVSPLEMTTTDLPGDVGYNMNGGNESNRSIDTSGNDWFPDTDYTTVFGGTSSASPLVSGITALVKEAQPALDTRFVKHLFARTSALIDPDDNTLFSRSDLAAQLPDTSRKVAPREVADERSRNSLQ